MFPSKFGINWPFGSGEEAKNRFSRWWLSWIFDQTDFSYFFIYKSPRCFLPSIESVRLLVQEKKRKIDFLDGSHGGHLGFPIGTILAIFDLQVIPKLPTKFRVNWLLGLGEEVKNRWRPSWIFDQHDFSYF